MAKPHFFPSKIADQRAWLVIYIAQLPIVGPGMGMTAQEITDNVTAAQAVITAIDATNMAENAYKQSVEDKNNAVKDNVSDIILPAVKRAKTASTYTTGAGQLLGVEGSDTAFDPDTYRPTGSAKVLADNVKISFVKDGADGMVIYSRIVSGGEPTTEPPTPAQLAQFSKLALDHHSPYVDTRPLRTAGSPEVREYYLRGTLDDALIGLPSDIIRVVVGD